MPAFPPSPTHLLEVINKTNPSPLVPACMPTWEARQGDQPYRRRRGVRRWANGVRAVHVDLGSEG